MPTGPGEPLDARLAAVASLAQPERRALYGYVVAQREPVTRDQAAAHVGVPRHVAKFHLDRLVTEGLLEADYRRPPGRGGPGAGRPAKVYRRSAHEVDVSLPERRYELAGRVLARAVSDAQESGVSLDAAVSRAAIEAGLALGEQARRRAGRRAGRAKLLAAANDVLADHGYQPQLRAGGVELVNCPFHALAREYTDLVCGMNLALLQGLLDGLGAEDLRAVLDPVPDRCCVRLTAG